MRQLVFGGTRFLSRAVAVEALARGSGLTAAEEAERLAAWQADK